jgi:hypothetical protein
MIFSAARSLALLEARFFPTSKAVGMIALWVIRLSIGVFPQRHT